MKDLTGEKFGKLTVLKYVEKKGKKHMWLCKCDCGNESMVAGDIKRDFPTANLQEVKFPEGKKVTKRWLRNNLIFLTAELRLVSDEMGVKKAV